VPDQVHALAGSDRVDDRSQVISEPVKVIRGRAPGRARLPCATDVVGDHVVSLRQEREQRSPELLGVGIAVDEHHCGTLVLAGLNHGELYAVRRGDGSPCLRGLRRTDRSSGHAARIYTLVARCSFDVDAGPSPPRAASR
jgi:hypothetical protein